MCPQASSGYKRRTGRNGQSAYGFRSRSLTMLGSMRSMHHGPHAWLGTSHRTSVDRRDAHLTYRVQGAGTLRYRLKSSQAKPSQVDSIRFDSTSQQPGDTYGVQGTSSPPPHPPDGPCGGLQGTGPSRSLCTSASVSSSPAAAVPLRKASRAFTPLRLFTLDPSRPSRPPPRPSGLPVPVR